MEKEFVPYEEALALKELGFTEPCLGWYLPEIVDKGNVASVILGSYMTNWTKFGDRLSTPTFSQAFRWFREKYGIGGYVRRGSNEMHEHLKENGFSVADYEWCINKTDGTHTSGRGMKDTYEEAELACLDKLIEIIKTK